MTAKRVKELFSKHQSEYKKFDRVEWPHHPRPDIAALILVDDLSITDGVHDLDDCYDATGNMIADAHEGQILFNMENGVVLENITEENIIELIRCGVFWEERYDALSMYV